MRHALLAAVALAPLSLAGGALAQTTITANSSTPLATSAAGDVSIASGATLTAGTSTPAITIDSNNSVSVVGAISADNVADAVGVLVQGGHTGSLSVTGSITNTEDFAATDSSNSDSVVEAPFASGAGRYGVRLTGAAPFTGDLSLTGTVTVKGQNSYGVSLEAPLAGSLTVATTSLTGDGGAAVRELAGVSGSVSVGGPVGATGQGSQAVSIGGDVGGALRISSSITATGYSDTARLADAAQAKLQATLTDVEQTGGALAVTANVAGGIILSAPPANTVAGSTADLDGDGVPDGDEGSGSVSVYGSAPALAVGAATKAITLGAFGTGDDAYGLINRGLITATGLEDGVTATAVQLGAVGGTVQLAGGLRNTGTISSTTYEADSTALGVLSGVSAAAIRNEGVVSAAIADSTLITTPTIAQSTAVSIAQGASITSLSNTGTISAAATGDAMSATAVVDRSGTLASVLNEGQITATVTPVTAGATPSGRLIALDLSANTTGVTLVQQANPTTSVLYGSTAGTAATASTTVTPAAPTITGDILLGSGVNTVQFLAGVVTGALQLGSGEGSSLLIDGGAAYTGALTYGGGSLALTVDNGSLTDLSTATSRLSSLAIGSAGKLTVSVDAARGLATRFDVSGAATIAAGGEIAVRLVSAPVNETSQTLTIVSSPQLSVADQATLTATTSYLFTSSLAADPTAGTLSLTLDRRSAADLGLLASEQAGLNGVLAGTAGDANLAAALLAPSTRADFVKVYDQLLPEHGGGVFLAAREAAESIGRAISDRYDLPEAAGAWLQEFGFGVEQDAQAAVAEHAGGFGFAGGAEKGLGGLGVLGVSAAFDDAKVTSPDIANSSTDMEELEAGLYWRVSAGGLLLTARGAAGYVWGDTERDLAVAAGEGVSAESATYKSDWHGWTADARFGAGYQVNLGPVFVRPQLAVEYFRLDQNGYAESGPAATALTVGDRTGDASFGTASVVFGGRLGRDLVWRPSLEVGARDVWSGDAGATTARFTAGGDPFVLPANPITGVGGLVTAGLKVGTPIYQVFVDAHGEEYAHYREGDVRAGVKFVF